ncbi:major facilitator superfamily domain-containing protein [Tribonema minus]|uniref:Major facilitator superfamily domain-containing protein n=1 Tax=Tribonema minus TaxID=303371 RepID=A0A836CPE2_9STRA|nr:major facilitator superfamily domain-containing protein [Tribonema minus]
MAPFADEESGQEHAPLHASERAPLLPSAAVKAPPPSSGIESDRTRHMLGAAYMVAMGMCGVVLVALGSTLEELAEHCGRVSTTIGSVFIARGFGAVFGAVASAQLYRAFHGNTVIVWALLALSALLLWLPYVTNVWALHGAFLCLGLCTAVTDTGCQIMTRRAHGCRAGPWLGANTVAFGLSGALVPCISYATDRLIIQYALMSAMGVSAAIAFIALPTPEKQRGFIGKRPPPPPVTVGGSSGGSGLRGFVYLYRIEFTIGFMIFWLIGGKVGATAYLTQYVADTGIIPDARAPLLIAVLWLAITVGRILGIQAQRTITLSKLHKQCAGLFIGGAAAAALPLVLLHSAAALWIAVALYGTLNGPCVGYCYDLNNRITFPSETGMSIVMFGLNCGSSFIPFAISGLWDATQWPSILFVFLVVSHLLPFPALLTARRLHTKSLKGVA